jgi:hypothetical protein
MFCYLVVRWANMAAKHTSYFFVLLTVELVVLRPNFIQRPQSFLVQLAEKS